MTILFQTISTGIAGYLCMIMGIMFTWPSSTVRLFSSTNTTLNRPMTETEVALLGSLPSISALISIPCVSYIIETIGKKYCCMMFSVLQVINWVIITVSYNVEAILTAIFLSGLCNGILMVLPIYVSEICQDSIRGRMTSGAMVFCKIGMLVSYLMGGYLKYDVMNYVCLSMTVLGVVLISFLKESPMHLMRKGHENEAAQAIAFYRGTSTNSKLVKEELQVLRRVLNPDLGDTTPEEEKLRSDLKENSKVSWWQFLKKSRSTRKALIVILLLNTTVIFQAVNDLRFHLYWYKLRDPGYPNSAALGPALGDSNFHVHIQLD
ncbi:unnamed protein product [Parnassius mnemosyne]|uniref:Uncharacterized protein n=1 Tax=Parnassius mnemosyne TaxID=213953 RepID=A0AAV1LBI6_9NEOP